MPETVAFAEHVANGNPVLELSGLLTGPVNLPSPNQTGATGSGSLHDHTHVNAAIRSTPICL